MFGEWHTQVGWHEPRGAERGGPGRATATGPTAGRVVMVAHVGGRVSLERRGRVVHGHRLVRQHDVRVREIQRSFTRGAAGILRLNSRDASQPANRYNIVLLGVDVKRAAVSPKCIYETIAVS